jgi:hypothetical protein
MLELRVFPEVPLYEYRTKLSGVEYWLKFDYSEREDRWSLYLLTASKELYAGPLRIACGRDLLARWRWRSDCPPGVLLALDPSGSLDHPGAPPGFADFGRRVRLFYDEDV